MDYREFRRHIGKAGLTVADFAAMLGITPTAVSNHSKGKVVPRSYAVIAVLLGDSADRGVDPRAILTRYGVHADGQVVPIASHREFRPRREPAA